MCRISLRIVCSFSKTTNEGSPDRNAPSYPCTSEANFHPVGSWRRGSEPARITRSFGSAYWAIPDGDEFECATPDGGPEPDGAVAVPGNPEAAGEELEADVEGLAIYYTGHRGGYLLVSSQGDDTYHVYDRRDPRDHLASFTVDGTGQTDGHDVTNVRLTCASVARFPTGCS